MEKMKTTCLHSKHVELGALMSPFAGFDMPIQYAGIVDEHNAVRQNCGVFDVSHMGEVLVKGNQAEEFVNYIFTNDIAGAANGKVFYGMMLHDNGGVVDDLLVYKRNDHEFFLVINASNIDKDVAHILTEAANYDVEVQNLSDYYSEIAVQGPDAENVLRDVLAVDCSDLTFYTFKDTVINGTDAIVSRTGYTGEDGFEIYGPAPLIVDLWQKLMDAGIAPCGLGCRDTLRFEAGLPLYGDELTDDVTPVEAALSMFAPLTKTSFKGRDVIERQKAEGVKRKNVGLELIGSAIPRHGYEVLNADDDVIGEVTTGYHSITLDKNLAMALIDSEYAKIGTELKIRVRRRVFPAVVIKKRFYTPNYKK